MCACSMNVNSWAKCEKLSEMPIYQKQSLPAIGGHCTSAAVLIGRHAQRNGPIESNGEI